jgi:hypothetical protein
MLYSLDNTESTPEKSLQKVYHKNSRLVGRRDKQKRRNIYCDAMTKTKGKPDVLQNHKCLLREVMDRL